MALYGLSRLSVTVAPAQGDRTSSVSSSGHPDVRTGGTSGCIVTLKTEATFTGVPHIFLQQQARFDAFVDYDNRERPHQALEMQVPAERYVHVGPAVLAVWVSWNYPLHDWHGSR